MEAKRDAEAMKVRTGARSMLYGTGGEVAVANRAVREERERWTGWCYVLFIYSTHRMAGQRAVPSALSGREGRPRSSARRDGGRWRVELVRAVRDELEGAMGSADNPSRFS